jgi:hypothetical protein
MRNPFRIVTIVSLLLIVGLGQDVDAQDDNVATTIRSAEATYHTDLTALADWCVEQGRQDLADRTRALVPPQRPDRLYLLRLPDKVGAIFESIDMTDPIASEWGDRLNKLRHDRAYNLVVMARAANDLGRTVLAFHLLNEALAADPDYEMLRTLMGYEERDGYWRTKYEIEKLRRGSIPHEKFGWLPEEYIERYEQGERYFQGHWMPVEQEAFRRNGWAVESEHFTVQTNASLEAGVALGYKLEELHEVWRRLFLSYVASSRQASSIFEGRGTGVPFPNLQVVYYRDRASYLSALRRVEPQIDQTIGMYMTTQSCSYFYPAEQPDDFRTIFHEATHQLFQETRRTSDLAGVRKNYWITEGVALYMESFRIEGEFYVLGGFGDDVRLDAAVVRRLRDDFYIPLDEFSSWGLEDFQRDPRIATLYTQAAGLTHFFFHAENGKHRCAFIDTLDVIYAGRDDVDTLSEETGDSYETLDAAYRAFLEDGVQYYEESGEESDP